MTDAQYLKAIEDALVTYDANGDWVQFIVATAAAIRAWRAR